MGSLSLKDLITSIAFLSSISKKRKLSRCNVSIYSYLCHLIILTQTKTQILKYQKGINIQIISVQFLKHNKMCKSKNQKSKNRFIRKIKGRFFQINSWQKKDYFNLLRSQKKKISFTVNTTTCLLIASISKKENKHHLKNNWSIQLFMNYWFLHNLFGQVSIWLKSKL